MTNTKTIHRWYWVWDFEKEEQWLNGMAQEGWILDSVGFCTYHFVACGPEEYTVRLEMHDHDTEYIDFMKETGAEYIGRMAKWIYFRKKASDGVFDIFSDIDSKIAHLNKIGKMLLVIGIINFMFGTIAVFDGFNLGSFNLMCVAFLMYALGRIHGKKESLMADRILHE